MESALYTCVYEDKCLANKMAMANLKKAMDVELIPGFYSGYGGEGGQMTFREILVGGMCKYSISIVHNYGV